MSDRDFSRGLAAFDAPSAADHRDRIAVRDYVVAAEIGAFQEERGVTQRVRFDVVVDVAPHGAARADDVDQILSYDKITEAIEAALAEERLNLLETLAERVAEMILAAPRALRVYLSIAKLDRGPGTLGVEIVRAQDGGATAASDAPAPRILALAAGALEGRALAAVLDRWHEAGAPLIVCVGAIDMPVPVSISPQAQRCIALLALEQSAWVLAGEDARCVVVGSRTELDWALRRGTISVWAPPKMVLDAGSSPPPEDVSAGPLIAWFAREMKAQEILTLGLDMTAGAIPVREIEAPT